ncbi:MAG: S26 family signal peptidase [Thermoplasmata archaeon]|nr:S26 family signal peptidase [Thermoplasmata archaeon]
MNSDARNTMIVIVIALIVIVGGFLAISYSSGVKPPFTVVESHSMQHCSLDDKESRIGNIDTGDLILVRSPDKTDITTYVEGYQNGYEMFGDYGDVIVYKRPAGNPVIHRAFLWLNYNGDGTWTADALKDYDSSLWDNGGNAYNELSGTVTFYKVGNVVEGGKTVTIDLNAMLSMGSTQGYLTIGDSVNNMYFDQMSGIYPALVDGNIKSVAWKEIPWLGAIKLIAKHNKTELDTWAPNTTPLLVCELLTVILIFIALNYLFSEIMYLRRKQ